MKHILVATDGSPTAGKALDLAIDLAKLYDARLSIVHVLLHGKPSKEIRQMAESEGLVHPHESTDRASINIPAEMVETLTEAREAEIDEEVIQAVGETLLARAKARANDKGLERVDTHLLEGETSHEIVAAAEKHVCDTIVIGSRGLDTLSGLLLGSVSNAVARHAACTCIMVR